MLQSRSNQRREGSMRPRRFMSRDAVGGGREAAERVGLPPKGEALGWRCPTCHLLKTHTDGACETDSESLGARGS